jgi:hypothetical protein
MNRKPGRPKKTAATPLASPSPKLATYAVDWRTGDGISSRKEVLAHAFGLADNGDLILWRDDRMVAAFRDWQNIVEMKLPEAATTGFPSTAPHVDVSPNGARTTTFANGHQLIEADRPE